ncbi:hypothetical protein [Actinomadura sp. WMMA1423]|uniref:hypothetical protein n=1 Tax=Actinomadura sp. WMMA1423 TaxID=2591108 RepID=UPI001146D71E|nr:hypothetical protein [Actinomadura sp. WMMA1423]
MLPRDTAGQRAVVRACMIGDPAIYSTTGKRPPELKTTGPGTRVSDFRVLATSVRDSRGVTVLLGSKVAHRLCLLDASGRPSPNDHLPHAPARAWAVPLSEVPNEVLFDQRGGGTQFTDRPPDEQVWESHSAGRVPPGGTRLTFTAPDGRTVEAPVTDRFFVLRRSGYGPEVPRLEEMVQVAVKLYNGGQVLAEFSARIEAGLLE